MSAYTHDIHLTSKSKQDPGFGDRPPPVNDAPSVPSLFGVPLKYISLVTLAVQNAALTIIMHYSRVTTSPSETYSAAAAVLMNELLKGLISLVIAFTRIDGQSISLPYASTAPKKSRVSLALFTSRCRRLGREVFSPDCWKLSIPSILYVIQNNLQYVAASNLDAATFQVTYQMKILTTAAFSVALLRKKLSPLRWLALLFLALGVGIVQIQSSSAHSSSSEGMVPIKGFLAVTAACMTSGLAGVYFEMVLKNSQADLWVRNVQLSLFSLLPALVPIIADNASSPREAAVSVCLGARLFRNFGPWAWATVFVQVLGGLITALVIKYSDNILKGFATSLSIVLSSLASVFLFDFRISFGFTLGSTVVLIATWMYNQPETGPASSSSKLTPWSNGSTPALSRRTSSSSLSQSYPTSPPDLGGEFDKKRHSSSASLSGLNLNAFNSTSPRHGAFFVHDEPAPTPGSYHHSLTTPRSSSLSLQPGSFVLPRTPSPQFPSTPRQSGEYASAPSSDSR